jgi:hypothetical protein
MEREIRAALKLRIRRDRAVPNRSVVRFAIANTAIKRMMLKIKEQSLAAVSNDQPDKPHRAEKKG